MRESKSVANELENRPNAFEQVLLSEVRLRQVIDTIPVVQIAGPARALGLSQKGHLGVGADADVALYEERPESGILFEHPRYVIKSGEVVVEDGALRNVSNGRQFIVRPAFDEKIEEYLRPLFQKVYTMSFDNYPVEIERLQQPDIKPCI